MSRLQIVTVSSAIVLLLLLFFGVRTSPTAQKKVENTRVKAARIATIDEVINQSKVTLSQSELNLIGSLESELDVSSGNDSSKLGTFKKLSSTWYQFKKFGASGFYAEEVAQIDNTDSAWSIAGYSYALCFSNTEDNRVFNYCYEKAVAAFENAASLAPDSTIHKENLAFCYTQNPDVSQVMEGVKIYKGILEQDSTNLKVLLTLGKLSVDFTKDYVKAINRLERAIELAPNNFEVNYYLAKTYQGLNNKEGAKKYFQRASSLTNNSELKKDIKDILNKL